MPPVSFYFDYRSPYAYLAHSQLRPMTDAIDYRPFEIRTLMAQVGNVPTSVVCRAKNRYVQADLRRWVAAYGVLFSRHPRAADIDAARLLRATLRAAAQGPVGDVVAALFDALWADPKPLDTAADVSRVLEGCGRAPDTDMDAPTWHDALARATHDAAVRGVFGAPTFFVGDEMFFGNDRLDFVRAQLGAAA